MERTSLRAILACVTLPLAAGACSVNFHDGPTVSEPRSVDLDHSESVRVELKMGAGELSVHGGSSKLMDGTFTVSPPELKPDIDYSAGDSRGHLRIEEPSGMHFSRSKENWDLRLNDDVPADVEVNVGAGEAKLDLGTLNLRSLDVQMGVGELRLDLRGKPTHDYTVNVHGGVGEATVYLPSGVGIVADVKGGIGEIKAGGLEKRDGHYVNRDYGLSKTTVRLDIRGGVGSIRLVTD